MTEPIRGIVRGYVFRETRQDLRYLFNLVKNHQLTPNRALEIFEQYVISGRELPDYLPDVESEPIMRGEN